MAQQKSSHRNRDIVTLADLAPRRQVKGGSQRRVFGADAIQPAPAGGTVESRKGGSSKGGPVQPSTRRGRKGST